MATLLFDSRLCARIFCLPRKYVGFEYFGIKFSSGVRQITLKALAAAFCARRMPMPPREYWAHEVILRSTPRYFIISYDSVRLLPMIIRQAVSRARLCFISPLQRLATLQHLFYFE